MPLPDELTAMLLADPALAGRNVGGVWLFGSFARGEARDDSDVDLAVLCEPPLAAERLALMDRLGRAAGRDVDVIDLSRAAPSLAWEVVTTGRLLVERDALAVEDFVRAARWAAEDDAHRSRIIVEAQTGRPVGAPR